MLVAVGAVAEHMNKVNVEMFGGRNVKVGTGINTFAGLIQASL